MQNPLPLAMPSGSVMGREPHAGIATIINGYAEPSGSEQKSPMQVWAGPGLVRAADVTASGGVRGMLEVDGVVNAVVGRALVQVDAGGNVVTIGGVPSDGYVGMARNQRPTGVQTIIVCDGLAWVTVGGSQVRITDADLPPPVDVCVVNRSAIFLTADGRMFRSEIDDATSVDALDTAQAESSPDGGHRVVDRGVDLVVFGPRSYEVHQDIGGEAFGYSRSHAAKVGSVGARSVTKASVVTGQSVTDTVAWICTDQFGSYAGVVMLEGNTPRRISTPTIDRLIEAEADKSAIVGTSWVSRGHGFASWRLSNTSIVYDTSTGLWHERQSRTTAGAPTTWRVGLATVLGGRVLSGDATSPTLYWLDEDASDEDGDEMVVTVRTPVAHAFQNRIELNQLYLDVVPGVGLATGASQDIAPAISMRISRDGETWGNARTREIGRQGQRGKRVSWAGLGTFDAATFEFSCSAAVTRGLMSAGWDGRVLPP